MWTVTLDTLAVSANNWPGVAEAVEPVIDATRPRPVMGDGARLADASHMTVSRVINNFPYIRPTTRTKVQRAIAQLGYRRNTAARALSAAAARAWSTS